jgi:hypothetical protein
MGMIKKVIVIEDIAGNRVAVGVDTIRTAIMNADDPAILLFGMGTREVSALYEQYLRRNGPTNITVESIKKVFD